MNTRPKRIPGLDGVRAIAVLGVIASHSGLIGLGWLGVDIFFGLSGYLITGILLDARNATDDARAFFVPFYMRRALRILPLAWVFAILVAAWRGEWDGIWWYIGYLVNWLPASPPPGDLGHYWSLAVEEQFYLIWPAFVFLASPRALWRITIAAIGFNVSLRFGVSMWTPEWATPQFLDLATFARADTLLVGALLAQHERVHGFGAGARWAFPLAALSAVTIVGIRLMERQELWPMLTYNLKWPVIAFGVGAGLVWVLTRPPRFLEWGWMVWIGKVSYGVYVIHAIFGQWLHDTFPLEQAPLIFAIQVGLTLPLAALSWYAFEAPILKLKRHWPMPRATEATPSTADSSASARQEGPHA